MGKNKKYNIDQPSSVAKEPAIAYNAMPSHLTVIKKADHENKHGYLEVIKSGLSHNDLLALMDMADLHLEEMARILHVNSRTIRRLNPDLPLNVDISEKVMSLLYLYKMGLEVFGDMNVFNEWMRRSIRGLGDKIPMDLLDTSIGVEIVMDELERLAYGVYN